MSWYTRISTGKLSLYRSIPKVDLHRHLEGSLRVKTLEEIAAQYQMVYPNQRLGALVQIRAGEALTPTNFLAKFKVLRQFYRSPEIIDRLAREAVEDAARDGVVHLEMRFTPAALAQVQGFALAQVMDWVAYSVQEASKKYGITVRLIASVNRHEPLSKAEEVARLAAERIDRGIVGLDLAGDEAAFPARPFAGLFREARESGLYITVHAGEWGGAENVREAIEVLGSDRIGHGVRVMEDPAAVQVAVERQIAFDVCLTSNVQSGVVSSPAAHPLPRMLDSGLSVTLNTDDPSISGITLSEEYILAQEEIGLARHQLERCILTGARSAFLPPVEIAVLQDRVQSQLEMAPQ